MKLRDRTALAGPGERLSWSSLESAGAVAELARFVREGGVVAFPTESSYALGADPASQEGVEAVFRIKGRPPGKPLPVVAADLEALEQLGIDMRPASGTGLLDGWPGPLTLVLPSSRELPAAAGRRELAVRVPGHRRLLALLTEMGCSLTATSANLAGTEPLLEPELITTMARSEAVRVIDQGRLAGGPPSTLVRFEHGRAQVLRQGAVGIASLRALAPSLEFDLGFSSGAVEISVDEGG